MSGLEELEYHSWEELAYHSWVRCPMCNVHFQSELLSCVANMADCPQCGGLLRILSFEQTVVDVEAAQDPDTQEGLLQFLGDSKEGKEKLLRGTRRAIEFERSIAGTSHLIEQQMFSEALTSLVGLTEDDLADQHQAVIHLLWGNWHWDSSEDTKQARPHYLKAVAHARRCQYPTRGPADGIETICPSDENKKYLSVEASALGNLGNICSRANALEAAEKYLEESMLIYKTIGSAVGEANQMLSLGQIHVINGSAGKGLAFLEQAVAMFRRLNLQPQANLAESVIQKMKLNSPMRPQQFTKPSLSQRLKGLFS